MPNVFQSLRLNNILSGGGVPSSGEGGFMGMPNMNSSSGPNLNDITNAALNFRQQIANQEINNLIQASRVQQGLNWRPKVAPWDAVKGGSGPNGENVVLGQSDELTPIQKASLGLQQQNLDVQQQEAQAKNAAANAQLNEKAREADNKVAVSQQDASVRQQRANTYDWKTQHPNAQVLQPKGGNYMLYDPATKEMHDSGISTGTMTQQDFQEFLQSGRESIQGMRGESAANVQNMRNQGALADINARISGQQQLQKNKVTNSNSATQQKTNYWNKAQQLVNQDQELGPFVTIGQNGEFAVQKPSTNFWGQSSGPTLDQYNKINQFIYGNPNGQQTNQQQQPPTQNNQPDNSTNNQIPGSKYQGSVSIQDD